MIVRPDVPPTVAPSREQIESLKALDAKVKGAIKAIFSDLEQDGIAIANAHFSDRTPEERDTVGTEYVKYAFECELRAGLWLHLMPSIFSKESN